MHMNFGIKIPKPPHESLPKILSLEQNGHYIPDNFKCFSMIFISMNEKTSM